MGLAKLYRITGEERYLKLAKFFLDCRRNGDEYNQAHIPVIEQDKIVGHAVRQPICTPEWQMFLR